MPRIFPALPAFALVMVMASSPVLAVDTRSSADTFVDGANTTTRVQNYGTQRTIRLRNSGQRLSFVRFPAVGGVSRAELLLRVDTVNVAGTVEVRKITSNWGETSVTYDTRPVLATTPIASRNVVAGDVGIYVVFDVTSLAQDWAANPAGNFGLAVIAAPGSPAQVYFNSREAGANLAPILRWQAGGTPTDNEVTVAPSGADYDDPVTAARNAHAGDTWCQPTPGNPGCQMRIAQGIYVLQETFIIPDGVVVTGSGSGQTQLVARIGLETAVALGTPEDSGSGRLENLTVINRQNGTNQAIGIGRGGSGFMQVRGVAVHAEGGISTNAAVQGSGVRELLFEGCQLSARGGQRAMALDWNGLGGTLRVSGSRLSAVGASVENTGLDYQGENFLVLQDTDVTADGGTNAVGVIGPVSEETHISVSNARIHVRSDGDALGLRVGGAAGFVRNTQVSARGAASGIGSKITSHGSPSSAPRVFIEDVITEGSTQALFVEGPEGIVIRDTLARSGSGAALVTGAYWLPLTIETSYLTGPVSVRQMPEGDVGAQLIFSSTVLAGARQFDSRRQNQCSNTYDEAYRRLNAQCQ